MTVLEQGCVGGRRSWAVRSRKGVAGLLLGEPMALGMTAAGASGIAPHTGKSAIVVKVSASRGGFKNVLTTVKGMTLYTAASCNSSCLSSWPRLLMPKGTSVPKGPKGLTGLGTVKVGSRLQVTYKKHRLYTFTGDSGSSVNGNNLAGFTVIKNA